jgi:hypothetical protein
MKDIFLCRRAQCRRSCKRVPVLAEIPCGTHFYQRWVFSYNYPLLISTSVFCALFVYEEIYNEWTRNEFPCGGGIALHLKACQMIS